MGPWGTLFRIALATLAVPLTLVAAGAPDGPWWIAAGGGAVVGVLGSAVETTLGASLTWPVRWLLWFGVTGVAVYSMGILWGRWPVTPWAPVYAGALTAVVELVLPADWLRP